MQTKNLVPVLGNAFANTSHVFFFSYAFKFAKMGGLNQGIIPIMTTLASLFNSVLFYFTFGEKISSPKLLGMFMTISCVVFLALASSLDGDSTK